MVKPYRLHHTVHCAEKIVSVHLRIGSMSAERMGQGKVGGITCSVLYNRQLLGLTVKGPWLSLGGQFLPGLHEWV